MVRSNFWIEHYLEPVTKWSWAAAHPQSDESERVVTFGVSRNSAATVSDFLGKLPCSAVASWAFYWGTLDMAAALVPDTLLGFNRTASPNATAQAARWPTAPDRPGLPRGHYFRAPKRYSLADAAEKTRFRLRHDLLAAIARLAAGWNLGFDPFRIAGLAFAWMVRSTGRMLLSIAVRCARFLGTADWTKSDR
jgi:hypothetical protein